MPNRILNHDGQCFGTRFFTLQLLYYNVLSLAIVEWYSIIHSTDLVERYHLKGVSSSSCTCRFGCPEQAFAQDSFESRLEFEVRFPAVDADDEFRQLEAPLSRQQLKDEVGPRFEAQTDELRLVRMRSAQEVDGAVRVRRAARRVMGRAPFPGQLADTVHTV